MTSFADGSSAPIASTNKSILEPTYAVGSWIWANETHDQQLCRLWREFEIPGTSTIISAHLRITADNSYTLYLDGRELGRGGEWAAITEHDITQLLEPGHHVLAVEAFNDYAAAGLLFGLRVQLSGGKVIEIASDESWKIVPASEKKWKEATHAAKKWQSAKIVGAFGSIPWHINSGPRIVPAPLVAPISFHFWQMVWFQVTVLSLLLVVAAICIHLMGRLAIQRQAQQVVQRERARIARDIHDDLTAGLTELVLLGEVAQSVLPSGSESREQVTKVCDHARGLSHSMNEIIWVVNSQRDTLPAFASYVCKYAETFLRSASIQCRFDVDDVMPNIPCGLGVRRNLFLAVKEALNNIARHAKASEVIFRLQLQKQQLVLTIEDNGRGFNSLSADHERNGLSNMMQRALEAGGTCNILSQPGEGCCIRFVVPLACLGQKNSNILARFRRQRADVFVADPEKSSSTAL